MFDKCVKEISVVQIMHETIKRIALSYQHKDNFSFWELRAMAGSDNLYEDYRIQLPERENDMACQRIYFAHVYDRGRTTVCYLVMKMSRGAGIYAIEADGSYLFYGMAKRWRISEEKQIGNHLNVLI